MENPLKNGSFEGTPIFGNTHINKILGTLHLGQTLQGISDTVLPALGLSRSRGVPASVTDTAGRGHGL